MTARHKDILITGATSGIGRATALLLARRGHRVFATGRNLLALAELEEIASAEDLTLVTYRLDVTCAESIKAVSHLVHVETQGMGVDVLINNAGYGVVAPTIEVTEADLRGQFETNVFGLVAVTKAFAPSMQARRAGTIINVGSVGGRVTLPLLASYNATKYAIESLSDGLRAELRPFGVRVSIIEPGVINTNFNECAIEQIERYKEASQGYAKPLGRMQETMQRTSRLAATPERVAKAIARAAESRRPSARYVVPLSTVGMIILAKLLPTSWVDALIGVASGLTRSGVDPVAGPYNAKETAVGEPISSPLTEAAAE